MLHRLISPTGFATCVLLIAASVGSVGAAEVYLDRLTCTVPQGNKLSIGDDNCRLHIYVDGTQVWKLRFNMRRDQVKLLNIRVEAQREVKLVLMEEDTSDGDDHVGTVTIPLTPNADGFRYINRNGSGNGLYALNYRVSARAATPATYFVTLDSLRCGVTEDSSTDQCRLDIYVDGRFVESLRRDMKAGQVWNLGGRRYAYQTAVTVRLWDLDNDTFGGGHDRLGDVTVGQTVGPNRGGHFGRDGASYHLSYRTSAVR